jgi:hypothetical protein
MEELIPMVLFMCIAGVLIMRPFTKKLGLLMEALARERIGPQPPALDPAHVERIAVAMEQLNRRLDLVDDRVAFMERLLEDRPHRRLTG